MLLAVFLALHMKLVCGIWKILWGIGSIDPGIVIHLLPEGLPLILCQVDG